MSERHTPGNPTQGPWGWFGNVDTQDIYLATRHGGRDKVMDFVRFGMQGAQPRFPVNGAMIPAAEIVRFEVSADATRRNDKRVYRGDIVGVRHADARLIAAAPELLEAAIEVRDILRKDRRFFLADRLEMAIEKAEGRDDS